MTKTRLSYYNYFLILSLVLIAGYFMTSLFFINKTSYSGEQVNVYSQITEQADGILKSAYRMESNAHSYLLTHNPDYYKKYAGAKCSFEHAFLNLKESCMSNNLAVEHIHKLEPFIQQRIDKMSQLVQIDSTQILSVEERIRHIDLGGALMDEVSEILYDLRSEGASIREENRLQANQSTSNAVFLLSIFGAVMLVIVFISFGRMKREILMNEAQTREISQINMELKSMNENLESFAYIASHDLNEPLRKIRTFGDLLDEQIKQPEINKEATKDTVLRMQNAAARMQTLINDLLSFSRITKRGKDLQKIDLNSVILEVKSDLQLIIAEKEATIEVEELPKSMRADPVQMRQLFQNLVSNALKFCKVGHKPLIKINYSLVSAADVPVNNEVLLVAEEYHRIDVIDNGIGFDEQYLDKIFVVFQRLHGRSNYEGTGIGLSICKKIVEQHQGHITASSKEGEGAQFYLFFPIFK